MLLTLIAKLLHNKIKYKYGLCIDNFFLSICIA